jgi:homocysteine S-methyltransferase
MSIPAEQKRTPLVILDGGLGTTLSLPPFNITFTPETPLWSSHLLLSDSSLSTLLAIQTSFVAAGAGVLLTDTYQASFSGFQRTPGWIGEKRDAARLMRNAVKIARSAFDAEGKKGTVALSLGPYGATMSPGQEYSGKYDEGHREVKQLEEWHWERLCAFLPVSEEVSGEEKKEKEECWQNVDVVAFETVPLLKEIEAIRKAMSAVPAELQRPFWISCVFPGEGTAMPDGSTIKTLVKTLLSKNGGAVPTAIGLNCTKVGKVEGMIDEFEAAVQELIGSGEVQTWPSLTVYPDGTDGEVYNTTTMTWDQKEASSSVSVKCSIVSLI